jgi:hypothetical protein
MNYRLNASLTSSSQFGTKELRLGALWTRPPDDEKPGAARRGLWKVGLDFRIEGDTA